MWYSIFDRRFLISLVCLLLFCREAPLWAMDSLEHGFVDSNGVKIHYVTAGEGPLLVMIHGFPDYWYTWRDQIPVLAKHFKVIAIDQRGYVEAFKKSSFEGMLNYYKANYPREPYEPPAVDPPLVKCPVLMIHGLKDTALLPDALNDTWRWIEKDLTLVTLPNAGHFVQQDESQRVTQTISDWLTEQATEDQ